MTVARFQRIRALACIILLASALSAIAQTTAPSVEYHIYAGNTHAHTQYTWSHGEQWANAKAKEGQTEEPAIEHRDGAQYPGKNKVLKENWQKLQGPPAAHFALAKENGYDFYIVTDHSQEAGLQPPSPDNAQWVATQRDALAATDDHFVAIRGYEHSENDGPDGMGHINVINSAEYLNALGKGIHLQYLYKWLKTAKPNGDGPIVASFNHPGVRQYDDWAYRDPEITDIITMLEVINSNNRIHYEAFLSALDKGWKVSPVCGNDNHGFWGITHHTSRTFVLATERTKSAILDAMKHRRTYAALDSNIQCRYTVNGQVMGSTLQSPSHFQFDVTISDPDASKPGDKITKIEILKDHGAIAATYTASPPDYSITWRPAIEDSTSHYFFIRIYSASGGDAPNADPNKPMAWLAPVWTGR